MVETSAPFLTYCHKLDDETYQVVPSINRHSIRLHDHSRAHNYDHSYGHAHDHSHIAEDNRHIVRRDNLRGMDLGLGELQDQDRA